MFVPISALEASLLNILAIAQSGEVIEITSDGKPIVRIIGIAADNSNIFGALAGDGSVTWNGKKPSFAEPFLTLSKNGKPLSKIIQEDRN